MPTTWNIGPGKFKCNGQSSFEVNASRVQCKGLKKNNAQDPESCALACCALSGCNTWQYDTGSTNKGCWIGNVAVGTCSVNPESSAIWVGGQHAHIYENA